MRSLLLSQDPEMIEVLQCALDDLGIGVDVYAVAPWAGEEISAHRYDAVIVDFDVPGGDEFLRGVRGANSGTRALTFAIVNRDFGLPGAFAMGANLALQKPISLESARSSVRAAYGLIMQERRRYFRFPVETLVMVSLDEHTSVVATSTNVSEGGMALKCDHDLALESSVKLSFSLPGASGKLDAHATVVWKDPLGRAGIRFDRLSSNSIEALSEWIQSQSALF